MLKRKPIDLSINHERWLISYADFVTLLFAFFVVMYSVSQVNSEKYEELSHTLAEMFSSEKQLDSDTPIQHNTVSNIDPIAQLPALADQFYQRLAELVDEEAIHISSNELWLQISLNNRILFASSSVTPSRQAEAIFEDIASILQNVSNPIQVEGFTDNQAIRTEQFPSNWELSTARASAIVKLLVHHGVPAKNLAAVGYGEHQPIADNATAQGRAHNRRVVLMIGKHPRQRPALPVTDTPVTSPENQQRALTQEAPLEPLTLDNGEHLFTSDPELERSSINR